MGLQITAARASTLGFASGILEQWLHLSGLSFPIHEMGSQSFLARPQGRKMFPQHWLLVRCPYHTLIVGDPGGINLAESHRES